MKPLSAQPQDATQAQKGLAALYKHLGSLPAFMTANLTFHENFVCRRTAKYHRKAIEFVEQIIKEAEAKIEYQLPVKE